jgi:hypothetical protein
MVDKFKKGKRVYTHWDKKTEQVTVVKSEPAKEAPKIEISITADKESGVAADCFMLNFSHDEFILDFGFSVPGKNKIKVVSRVITNPACVKELLLVLKDKLK